MQMMAQEELRMIFEKFDSNGNGALDYKELATAVIRGDTASSMGAPRSVYSESQVSSSI